MAIKPIISTVAPIPKYSHTTLLFTLPLRTEVVKPSSTYIEDEAIKGQIVVGVGQKEKLRAISPSIKLKIKLCTQIAVETLSSILSDQSTWTIKGKLRAKIPTPFHKNNKLKA